MASTNDQMDQSEQTGKERTSLPNAEDTTVSFRVDPSRQSCKLCDDFDTVDMVRCDNEKCKSWYHFSCAGVTREQVESIYWECTKCVGKPKERRRELGEDKSSMSSESRTSSRSSVRKRKDLTLQRIEEERQLKEIRDKEYLDKKYQTLEQMLSSESEVDPERTDDLDSDQRSKQYTADWVENIDLTNDTQDPNVPISKPLNNEDKSNSVRDNGPSVEPRRFEPNFWQQYFDKMKLIGSSTTDERNVQQNVGRDRRQTTYSVFTKQAPINSSMVQNTPIGHQRQVQFKSFDHQQLSQTQNHPSNTMFGNYQNHQSSSIHRQAFNQQSNNNPRTSQHSQDVLISLNGGNPSKTLTIPRKSFQRSSTDGGNRVMNSIGTSGHEALSNVGTHLLNTGGMFSSNNGERIGSPKFESQTGFSNAGGGQSSNYSRNDGSARFGNQIIFSNTGGVNNDGQTNSSRFKNDFSNVIGNSSSSNTNNFVPPQAFTNTSNFGRNNNSAASNGRTFLRLDAEQIAARHAMPKNLPKFSGTPAHWPMFISAYRNSTSACGYSNHENLGRLMDCLDGDAKDAVRSILLHPDSVTEAIDTLELLYGRPELIIESMVDELNQESSPKENDLNSLVKYALKVRNLVATVRSFDSLDYLRNPLLLKSLVDKLPSQTRINWAYFKANNPDANLSAFSDWFYNLARVTSQVIGKVESTKKDSQRKDHQKVQTTKSSHLNAQIESSKNVSSTSEQNNNSGSNHHSENSKHCPICSLDSCKQVQDCSKFRNLSLKERWDAIKGKRLCFSCFGKHRNFKCRLRKKCQINGCESTHHVLLHDNEKITTQTNSIDSKPKNKSSSTANTTAGNCNSLRSKQVPAIFKIVPVILYGKRNVVNTYAYLDGGSDLSLMERDIASQLGLSGTPDVLNVHWAFSNTDEETDTEAVSVRIAGDFKFAETYKIENVYTVSKLYLPSQSITRDWLDSYSHLKDLQISTYDDAVPKMLIGLYSSKLMVSQQTVEGGWTEPIACKTRLGWVVQGPDGKSNESQCKNVRVSMNMCESYADNQLHQLVKEFFSFENCGIRVPEQLLESKEVTRAREIMERTTIKKNGRYETGLLWRYDDVHLPDSYGMAMRRLICLENKMKKDPNLSKKLCDQMMDFVGKKYIRKLLPHEIEQKNSRTWYLPIFVVFNPKKPLKVRTVWDAAAKVKDVSLNSVLLKGPDQLVPLPDVLRRFRERLYAITGDIGEMYHRVGVIEEDRCAQRFLWRDGQSDRSPDIYSMDVLTFGAACSPSSAQFVKNKNALQYKNKFPRAVEAIVDNTYIDDMLDCTDTKEEALSLVNDVKFIHNEASFQFGKITSNSMEILCALGEEDNQQIKNLNLSPEITTERVLGMFWNTSTDMFTYSLKYAKIDDEVMSGDRNPTKREVLRALTSIFDPLGLIANVLVYAKILLQKIWRKSTDWDEPISESLHQNWLFWIRLLPQVECLEIPRLYSPKLSPQRPKSIQMHTFVDASNEACAAATFFRFEDEFGVDCILVGAKTKVAPNKPLTIPRLELQAAVLGTRLAANIEQSQRIKIDKKMYWSDSQTVLSWIMSETRKYNQFVAFRVGEILENSAENEWNWVSTDDNVADEATKSSNKPKISSSSRWFKGPQFLYQPEDQWNKVVDKNQYTTDEELRPRYLLAQFVNKCENVIDPNKFSNWKRLRRTFAFVLRFINNLRLEKKNRQTGSLTRMEYIRAENQLYQQAQRDKFLDEIIIIQHNRDSPVEKRKEFDRSSPLRTCSPYIDDFGVMRIKGRIDAAKHLSFGTKRPIILPRDHQITKLIVLDYHRKFHHLNHQSTLNELHQKYFIHSPRRALKSVIHNVCQRCKNDRSNPQVPEMADLPPARVATDKRPFTFVGIDYFGPFMVKVNRTIRKRWGVLITCLTTRAIHIEVAEALTTSECIMAIRRFNGRRGSPIEYHSDNGTNFHGSEKELRAEFEKLDFAKIEETFTNSVSQWTFNPPLAPHMGGSWERMIRTVKSILRKTMPTRKPTEKMFETFLIEAEHIINSRPLTYVHLDHTEDEVLTPNHFLLGSSGGVRSPGKFDESCLLRDDWKAVQHMTDLFWRRFNIEYLPTLTRRTKWFTDVKPIAVGDVVIIVDDKHERNTWPKGIVEEVYPGRDNKIRSARIRLVRGRDKLAKIDVKKIKHQSLVRPVAKLAVLDVQNKVNTSDEAAYGREDVENTTPASNGQH